MTEQINDTTLDKFEKATSYDIKSFFSDYVEFIDSYYSLIVNFYSGTINVVPTIAINKLNSLIKEQKKVIDVTILNAQSISNYEFWALLEYVEDIGHILETANNISKWLRSAVTKNGYKQQVVTELMISQGDGLERVERVKLKSNDPNNTWVQTAIENQLREEDYTNEGGALIKVVYKNNSAIFLNGVVDNIDTPEKTYGKDIDKNITFEDDDLVVLSYQDTIVQCAKILSSLKKEDDPSFPERGINNKILVGGNIAAISYPILFRDLANNFSTDDSFKSFSVTDVRRDQDAIYLDFQVQTKAGDFFNESIQL